jgi:N6-L-threonylcarbamoyladenine synthase
MPQASQIASGLWRCEAVTGCRDHIRRVLPLTEQVLAESKQTPADIDVGEFTRGLLGWRPIMGAGAALRHMALQVCAGVHHLKAICSPF